MKLFITGGVGFVGSNFIFYMRKTHPDYDLLCLDKLTYAGNLETLAPVMNDPKLKVVRIDISDRKTVYDLFEAESHVDRSVEDHTVFLETNVMGSQVLLDACRIFGTNRFHRVSTDEVSGDTLLDRLDMFFTEQPPSTHPAIPPPKPRLTCCAALISIAMVCLSPLVAFSTTTDFTSFRRSSSP